MSISNPSERSLLIAGYVLGDLSLEESLAFEKLLASDPVVVQQIADLQAHLGAAYGPEIAPPSGLKASVLAQADCHLVQPADETPASQSLTDASGPVGSGLHLPTSTNLPRKSLLLLASLLAAMSLYLGFQNYRLRQSLQAASQTEQSGSNSGSSIQLPTTYTLEPTEDVEEAIETSSVALLIGRDRTAATLKIEDLPVLSSDQVYVLWTVTTGDLPVTTDSKDAILTAVFTGDPTGTQTKDILLPSVFRDLSQIKAIAVTIEAAAAPQKHESSPILKYNL